MRCSPSISVTVRFAVAACVAFVFAAVSKPVPARAARADRPNVVIIYADDLGWGDLGCFGHPRFKTPNLDRLAAEGAKLTNFYSSCPYCAPSRASLQTGRYHVRTTVTTNPCPDRGINDVGLPASEVTLGEAFKQAGYHTICIGKWHLGHKPEFHPLKNGYDEYLGILYSNDMHPVELWNNDKVIEYPVIQATLTKRYTQRAIDFIERYKDEPFFVYLPHAMPHKPLAASEDWYTKTGTGLYGDVISELDWGVGEIVSTIKKLGLERQTLLFFTSDNGPWFGGSTNGLRGMKGQSWEGGIRVPLIAWWPAHIPAGHISNQPAIIMDLFTTALLAAGIDLPGDRIIDGKDIMPLLTSDADSPHEVLYAFSGPTLKSVRVGPWKLHVSHPGRTRPEVFKPDEWVDPRRPDGVRIIAPYEQARPNEFPGLLTGDDFKPTEMALFNLESDLGEQHNVAADHPDIVARLKRYADDFKQ